MKKSFAIILALALALSCTVLAEEEGVAPMPEEASAFSGIWVCDRASIEVDWEDDGFKVFISWGSSVWEHTEWEYSCFYNAEGHSLEAMPFGTRTDITYGENDEIVSSSVIYEDGEATFTLDEEGHLLWQDMKEDAGKDMAFERMDMTDAS